MLIRLTSGGQNGHGRWENWLVEKEHVWHKGRSKQLGRDWQEHVKSWSFQLGTQLEESVPPGKGVKFQVWHTVMTSCSQDPQND